MKTDNTNNEIDIKQLKSIRENQGMTIESLAESLKITRDFVHYIESGDFGKLGAPTFVKGHVKNYCKALGISFDEVLLQIPIQYLQSQTRLTSEAMGVSPLAKVKRRSNHLGRYAVGTALLGMLALSFYFVWDKWTIPGKGTDTNLQLAENNGSEKKNGKNVTYSSLIPQVKLQEESDDKVDNYVEDETTEILSDAVSGYKLTDESEGELSAADIEQNIENTEQQEQLLGVLQSQAKYSIELQLSEEAWISIKTNDGSKIEHDLVKAGAYTYQSDQPLHFRIGNAKNAQVKINEDVIDLNQFMKKNIADFNWPKDPG
ncbi:MAG: DUF4115 domain-containing protein [Xanthomonadales bacterium]|nr:DUF4115 domain-containing protein [Xanthomonadales bacterium]